MIDLIRLLEDMVRAIVEKPEEVKVTQEINDDTVVLTLKVAKSDMGMVIGKNGKIAKAIRSVIKAASANCGKKVNVEIK
mgnify:CR=1 FL=1